MREIRTELIPFGQRLKELRLERGLSQEELAHLAGLDRTYVSQAEQGRRNTTLITMQKIAAALGITIVELVSEPTGRPETSD